MPARVFRKRFVKDLFAEAKKDRITSGAAALAFYSMLALFPAMIFTLSLLPYLPVQNLDQAIMDLLKQAMPGEAANLFTTTVQNIVGQRKAGLLSFGFLFTLWSASSGMYAVMEQLNVTHGIEDSRPFWKTRAIALGLTVAAVVLVLGALGLAVFGGTLERWVGSVLGESGVLFAFFAILRWVIIGAALMLALAVTYHFGTDLRRKFKLVTPGTVFGTLALGAASLGFKLYVTHFGSYDKTYGSLGAVIVLLMWLFVTGLVILLGSEIDALAGPQAEKTGAAQGRAEHGPTESRRAQPA